VTRRTRRQRASARRGIRKENDIKFPNGKEKDASMSAGFNVSGIPAAAMVKNGKVIRRGHPGRLDDATIDKLISG
jgi:hypothetical protein